MKKIIFLFLFTISAAGAFTEGRPKSVVENFIIKNYDTEGFHIRMFDTGEEIGFDICEAPGFDSTVYRADLITKGMTPEQKEYIKGMTFLIYQGMVTAKAADNKSFNEIVKPEEGWIEYTPPPAWCDKIYIDK